MRREYYITVLALLMCILGACTPSPPVSDSQSPPASESTAGAADQTALPDPQTIQFESPDGVLLEGTYYPPKDGPAPGILFFHWLPGGQDDWQDFIYLVRVESDADLAFMTFNFRGHGNSGGSPGDRAAYNDDALAALEYFRQLPGVDPDRIIHIGASIGADAAVAGCKAGCLGVVSISPGGYTTIAYVDALMAMGDKPALCIATERDSSSAQTASYCDAGNALGFTDYTLQIYTGRQHAMEIFQITDQTPLLNDLLLAWLEQHIP